MVVNRKTIAGRPRTGASLGHCEVCGMPPGEHPRCNTCGALVGPGHLEESLREYKGLNLCGSCWGIRRVLEKCGHLKKKYYSDLWNGKQME